MNFKVHLCQGLRAVSILLACTFGTADYAVSQAKDSVKTGYMPDAAEEYWPSLKPDQRNDVFNRLGHIPIRNDKGFVSLGGSLREVYERFNNYLWGIGPQDDNGYFLHRILLHADVRYNSHFRVFGELQSSFVTGRNGGPRPVQDMNKLALTELFAEYATKTSNQTSLKLRVGEQALHYGVGSLLDIRDANVHRSFAGAKFIAEKGNNKLDVFAMELVWTDPGFFDDHVDASQKIAGAWFTHTCKGALLRKIDAFYLFTDRGAAAFTQGAGTEQRHTIGTGLTFNKNGWSAYSEAVLQLGKFNDANITAWKLTQTLGYQFSNTVLKPDVSLQSAISSGDKNAKDPSLQTFSPLYARAIYYGFIDNAGAANLIMAHLNAGIQPWEKINVSGGYYRFWRQSLGDGLYGPGGGSFLPASNQKRSVGQMFELMTGYQASPRFRLTFIGTCYQRGAFLKAIPETAHNIWYTGLNATLHF